LHLITGMPVTFGSFFKAGKRGYTLERHINTHFGVDRNADTLPKRLTDVPQIPGDDSTRVPLEKMKNVYYKARGWDKNGIPTKKTLHRLNIKLKDKA
ncbi:MAG: aldehyde:ferredoxin oxidoreductase, partial [Firmicutes bacterium]|nr:aldehyde:ferredoxin oxidoreductase [Bacillota bacterium]